jgi:hypothetical protein
MEKPDEYASDIYEAVKKIIRKNNGLRKEGQ